jgi:streptogramin lyase
VRGLRLIGPLLALMLLVGGGTAQAVSITEFRPLIAGSNPMGITAGPDGNLWFAEYLGSRVGRITLDGQVTDWSTGSGISNTARPWGIVAGPDGNLWYAAERNGKIGRMSPTTLTATEFPTASATTGPRGIAAGPDGNLWFAEYNVSRIGRITPDGVVTEFSAGITPASRPHGITAGPDGNLWFTEYDGKRIGRISTDGTVTEFPVPMAGTLVGIAAGPDGNVWFTDLADRIGRITPAGSISVFTAGISQNTLPYDITTGPDGNLWFTGLGGRVGRITTAGTVTEFSAGITANSEPKQIRTGPDGNLWFTEGFGNRIARVNIELPPVVTTDAASGIGSESATLNGSVNPLGSQTSYVFEYGRTTAYGSATASRILAAGGKPVGVSRPVGGLRPSTLYHYRLVAANAFGTRAGPDLTFTTLRAGEAGAGGGAAGTPEVDRAGPSMRISARRLRLVRGRLRIRVGCPLSETLGCRGTVTLRGGGLRLGSARFRIRGGQTRTIAIRVSRRGAARIRRAGRLRARIVVVGIDAAGNRKTVARRLSLRA